MKLKSIATGSVLFHLFIVAHFSTGYAQSILNIDQALEIAAENSPDLKQVKINLTRSQELLNAQKAALKSRFSLTLEPFSYIREREFNLLISSWNTSEIKSSSGIFTIAQPILFTDGVIALQNQLEWRDSFSEFQDGQSTTFSNNLYLSYDQPFFTYNRTRLALNDVQLDLDNSMLSYQIQKLLLERSVAGSFFSAFQNKMNLQIAKEDFQNRQESYQIIRNKVDAGIAAQEELYQAELDMTTSKSQVQNGQVTFDNSLDELKRLLGLPILEDIDVVAEISMTPVSIDLQKALNFGLANRLELRQRKLDIQTSQANLVRSAATNEFQGNLSFSYGIIGNDEEIRNIYDTPTRNQRATVSLEIPIWDWGEKESRTKAARATVEGSEISLEEEQKNIIISIRRAYRSIQNQVLQVELARQNVKMAQLTYDINLERYENGDLTSMDLNLFQNQLSGRKFDLITAMITYKLNLLDLKIESLYDFERDRAVFEESQEILDD